MASRSYSKIDLPGYEPDNCTFFALGRNAMYAACRVLGLRPGDEVLTPAFDCDGSLQPFRVLGLEIRFFRSDPYTLSVDIADLKRRITTKTRLLHIINHFGMPQPWGDLAALRREFNIPILEDNAYSLFSKFDNRLFGTFGDMAIFSLRKNLPLVDGGMLRVNNPDFSGSEVSSRAIPWFYPTEIRGVLSLVKDKLGYHRAPERLRRFVRNGHLAKQPPPPLYSETGKAFPDWPLRDRIGAEFACDYLRPMSRLAHHQLTKFTERDYVEIVDKKRQCYAWLSSEIRHLKGVTVLWPFLPDGIVPFCFSMLIESKRDMFLESLRKKYDVMAWPTLPKVVLDQLRVFPEVELLGRKLLQLNLQSHSVRQAGYLQHLKSLILDLSALSNQHLSKYGSSNTVLCSTAG